MLDSLFDLANNRAMKSKKIDSLWSHVHWLGMLATMGSFTAAAERLGVSKAAMSHRIGELERAAGVSLVQRTTRSVRLTEAGQQLVDATRASFVDIERSFEGVKDLAEEPSGLVRVTAPVALGRQQIVPLMPAFLRQHPQVRIELELSDRLSSLAQEGFDLAIRHVAAAPDTHVAWTLCETHSVLAATRAYLKRCGTPATPADLAGHNCLLYLRSGDAQSWSFEPMRGKSGRLAVAVGGNFAANNSEALREAALAGAGIALLPDFSARGALAGGKLVQVLPQWRPVGAFGERIYAIRPFSQHVPRAIQAFVSYLRETLKDGFVHDAPPE
jgi:DNA-binding transcriptional LysR family regulator